jgi:hypothetical protein
MSIAWAFHSFDIERWNAIFGSDDPRASDAVALSAVWEDVEPSESGEVPELPEDDDRVILAREIVRSGVSYDGLDPEDATRLDELILGFFCAEGLEGALAGKPESPEFVNMIVIDELLRRASGRSMTSVARQSFLQRLFQRQSTLSEPFAVPMRLLPLMRTGRRYGDEEPPDYDAMYVIFSPEELRELSSEIRAILALPGTWAADHVPTEAQENLVAVFEKVAASGRWLAGRHC